MSDKYTGPMTWPETTRKTSQWYAPDDGQIHFADLDYDFEDYFKRYDSGGMDEDERRDFSARVYGLFCRDFFKSGGHPAALEHWVVNYIAKKLMWGLHGEPWGDIMGMPWDEPTPYFTPRGARAFRVYAAIKNTLRDQPDARVTDLIAAQADANHVSYETARADYYTIKASLERKEGLPQRFLNSDPEN